MTPVCKAWVGGFCSHNFSTVVVEFGKEGRVVPTLTAGIQASNVVAHEMAHKDHERVDCLAPLTEKQLAAARHLNAWKDQPPPGQLIDADEQCQIFLKDHMARRAGKPEELNAPACKKPLTNKEYINQKCEYFSRLKPDLKPDGIQLPYDRNQTWRACSIYCRYRKSGYMFAQFDLADYPNVSSYLPDGTRCNFDNDTGAAYYCQGNQCATLLQSLAGIQDNEEGEALDVDADDWAEERAQGRSLVEKYLEYKPGSNFAVLDKKKIKHTPLRVHVDDAVEIPGT
ncbi:hypothetical protein IscW_ISCW021700 [Ixodes scapularis]|uniref:Uncharacterized protein n=1 Tax=Ixodes scapularis TaxID=6945 RepID=B7Q400_IXOSC|nr:hypothetical protein IscW_ISCW021700 [Ixodes scapularis]|eukprot:XP_002411429.1 hypothetical protein IscW_ISCW021700 [Ixodes scapularis]